MKKLESLFRAGKIWNQSKTGKRILDIVWPVKMEDKTGTKQVIFRCGHENFRCGESNRVVDTKNRIGEGEKSQGRVKSHGTFKISYLKVDDVLLRCCKNFKVEKL